MAREYRWDTASVTGTSTYSTTDKLTLTFTKLKHIDSLKDVQLTAVGTYMAQPASVSGNTVKVKLVKAKGSTVGLGFDEVANATDVSDTTVYGIARGW